MRELSWPGLRRHFVAATVQEEVPYDDEVVEWDYSRYARALGVSPEPGLEDRSYSGGLVLRGTAAAWAAAERRYAAWAKEAGWSFVAMGARGGVGAPDAFTYGLGTWMCGGDSCLFLRSGQGGDAAPARGRRTVGAARAAAERRRPAGLGVPLSASERWLIAADRVRRRARIEIARRGVVLFVEEAHKLSPAALGMLAYLLNAHRAWRGRMLSRPARLYVVFAVPRGAAGRAFAEALRRFDIVGHGDGDAPEPAETALPRERLDVEDEHVLATICASPLALARADVQAILGVAGAAKAAELAETGWLRARVEYGETTYAPRPEAIALTEELPAAAPRVLRAIRDRLRVRARAGRGHLEAALATVEARLGNRAAALALTARVKYAAHALTPLDHAAAPPPAPAPSGGGDADGTHREAPHPKAEHYASWFAQHAQSRDYERAKELANILTEHRIETTKTLHRVLTQVLCVGRTHLDAALPDNFWTGLKSTRLDPTLLDATAILADLFARMRLMSPSEIEDRFDAARRCVDALREGPTHMVAGVLELILWRVAIGIATLLNAETDPKPGVEVAVLGAPGYVHGTLLFARVLAGDHLCANERSVALDLVRCTGVPADARIQLTAWAHRQTQRGLRLLLGEFTEEQLLLVTRRMPTVLRSRFATYLHSRAGSRAWLVSAVRLLRGEKRHESMTGGRHHHIALANALLGSGALFDADAMLRSASVLPPGLPEDGLFHRYVAQNIFLQSLGQIRNETRCREQLRPSYLRFLAAHHDAIRSLLEGQFAKASLGFARARDSLPEHPKGVEILLRQNAADSSGLARSIDREFSDRRVSLAGILELVRAHAAEAGGCIPWGFLVPALECCARHNRNMEGALRVGSLLQERLGAEMREVRGGYLAVLADVAPMLFERLHQASLGLAGAVVPAASPQTTISSAMAVSRCVEAGFSWNCASAANFDLAWSERRIARFVRRRWSEDAGLFRRVLDHAKRGTSTTLFGRDGEISGSRSAVGVIVSGRRVSVNFDPPDGGQARTSLPSRGSKTVRRLVGSSQAMRDVDRLMSAAAECDLPVLLTGASGVGKEVVAREIHRRSSRGVRQLVVADCASTVDALLHSELFGHLRGAFTGATEDREGLVAAADGSSLLLDDVDNMSPRLQVALLRVLEAGEFRPVGAGRPATSDFRLISVASPMLPQALRSGSFREDLYYRISGLRIEIPELRHRGEDVIEIARAHLSSTVGKRLARGAEHALLSYAWPGNVRQLINVLNVCAISTDDRVIGVGRVLRAIEEQDSAAPAVPSELAQRLMNECDTDTALTALEIAARSRVSIRSAQRHLAGLVRSGLLVRLGAGRSTRYKRTDD